MPETDIFESQVRKQWVHSAERKAGIIRSWGRNKGYGFITSGNETFFLHVSQLLFVELSDMVGSEVSFIPDRNVKQGKTPLAKEVKLA